QRVATASLQRLSKESFEFADQRRRLVPRIVVFPHRLCDSDHVVLRAKFKLYLSRLAEESRASELLAETLDRVVEIDLFDPPQREAFRTRVMALRQMMSGAKAARCLQITTTAAQRAAHLQRLMDKQGLSDPYVPVTEPVGRLRRHLHPRYRFNPLPDAGQL
ncbi:MAG TPA: hypothetical protein PJ982_00875, partial [Lacipirellulaceae bacterium]|nr:hypothetical protein [Lacipirellulaceae bacterium]